MDFQPGRLQTLFLLKLLFTGEEPIVSKAQPKLSAADRKALVDNGFIDLVKRPGKRGSFVTLTDKAWDWANGHLDSDFSLTINGARALQGLLPRLQNYLNHAKVTLAEILADDLIEAEPEADGSVWDALDEPTGGATDTETRIRKAYVDCSGGRWNTRVRLKDLRKRLPDMSREGLDHALLDLQSEGKLALYALDDPSEITDEDEAAALDLGLDRRHILYMGEGS